MAFVITFDNGDLEKLSNNLTSQNHSSSIIPDVNSAIDKFHNTLANRVSTLYKAPASLDTVRKKSGSFLTGALSMEYDLVYVQKPITLAKYKLDFKEITLGGLEEGDRNGIPYFNGTSNRFLPINKAESVRVTIKNGSGGASIKRQRTQFKKFFVKGINEIFVRTQKETWLTIPSPTPYSKGVRTPIKLLFGPSLAELAAIVYDNDSVVDKAKDKVVDDIFTAFTKGI